MEIIFIATVMETALVAILLTLFFVARYFVRKKNRAEKFPGKIYTAGNIISKAIVLSVRQENIDTNNIAKMKILLQVMPDKGRNFVVEITQTLSFSDLAAIRMGNSISVKYNPANIKDIRLVKQG